MASLQVKKNMKNFVPVR